MRTASEILYEHWGYASFRPLQEDIIQEASAGRDVLALLPTGGGKSICYQIPGILREGVTIVISPLIALMKDQLEGLRSKGIIAETISSQVHPSDIDRILDNCIYGGVKFLFIAPERIGNELFMTRLNRMPVALIAVDEAHCISQWGHEFRPAYRRIAEIREVCHGVPVIALTATATPEVVDDIQDQLAFKEKNVIQGSFARSNISFQVRETEDKRGVLLQEATGSSEGSGIIYVRNRRKCRELAELLRSEGIPAGYYHAGLDTATRTKAQDDWLKGTFRFMVATNAFGMGIDKSDVRMVIHFDLSDSLESYYQEAGRAGRDGRSAQAVQLFNESDMMDVRKNLARSYPQVDSVKKVYQVMSDRLGLAAGSGAESTFGVDLVQLAKQSGLGMFSTLGALKILEQNGYIHLHKGLREPSRVQLHLQQARWSELRQTDSEMGKLLQVLLRHRTNLYQSPVAINEEQLAQAAKIPVKSVELLLEQAENRGILTYHKRKGSSSVTYVLARQYDRDLRLDTRAMQEMRQRTVGRQNALFYYLKNELDCRMVQILRYFGEQSLDDCGKCDVCTKTSQGGKGQQRIEMLLKLRDALAEEQDVESIRSTLAAQMPDHEKVLRWAVDKGYVGIEGKDIRWTGPRLATQKAVIQ
ncbi:MAG: RecQ family ATP-dependent DNA helicase [Flavobacteriales bacterium]|nr:RecQ family ATP-dependent DNA helicase [Flavobacteriales bacterium]